MRKSLKYIAFAFALGGCATVVRGTTQQIAVNTPGVSGAMCTLTSSAIGSRIVSTPATVTVEKGRENISVRCTAECYSDGVGIVASSVEGTTAGNLILGGVVGLGVDAASGAINSYASQTDILMTPVQGCKRKRS
jgi:hypothetical protein